MTDDRAEFRRAKVKELAKAIAIGVPVLFFFEGLPIAVIAWLANA